MTMHLVFLFYNYMHIRQICAYALRFIIILHFYYGKSYGKKQLVRPVKLNLSIHNVLVLFLFLFYFIIIFINFRTNLLNLLVSQAVKE